MSWPSVVRCLFLGKSIAAESVDRSGRRIDRLAQEPRYPRRSAIDAPRELRLFILPGCTDDVIDRVALRSPDADAQARELLAAQGRDDGLVSVVAAIAAAATDAQPPERQIEIVADDKNPRRRYAKERSARRDARPGVVHVCLREKQDGAGARRLCELAAEAVAPRRDPEMLGDELDHAKAEVVPRPRVARTRVAKTHDERCGRERLACQAALLRFPGFLGSGLLLADEFGLRGHLGCGDRSFFDLGRRQDGHDDLVWILDDFHALWRDDITHVEGVEHVERAYVDLDLVGDVGRQRFDRDLADDKIQDAAFLHARRRAGEHETHVGLDDFVEANGVQVDVDQALGHDVELALLHDGGGRAAAFDLEVQDGRAAVTCERSAQVLRIYEHRKRSTEILAVDDARDAAVRAHAANCAPACGLTGSCFHSGLLHTTLPIVRPSALHSLRA